MARRIAVELTLEARNYIDEAVRSAMATKAAKDEMEGLDHEVTVVEAKLDSLAVTSAVAAKEVGNVGDKSNKATRDLAVLDRQIAATERQVAKLAFTFAATGDRVAGQRLGDQQSMLGKLQALRTTLQGLENDGRPVVSILEQIGKASSSGGAIPGAAVQGEVSTPVLGPVLIAGISTAVVAALPALGAMIGGAVAGAVGTLGIAAGILASTRSPVVKSALTDFTGDIERNFFNAGVSFVEPVRQGLAILDKDVADSNLDKVFAAAAPDVTIIATGLGNLVRNVMPGLESALKNSGPFATVTAHALADLGTNLGYMFDQISKNKGALEGLKVLFLVINGSIIGLTNTITFLGNTFVWLADKAAHLFRAMAWLADHTGNQQAAADFRSWAEGLEHLGDSTTAVIPSVQGLGDAWATSTDKAKALNESIDTMVKAQDDLLSRNENLISSQIAVAQGWLDLNDKLIKGKKNWDLNTQAGITNLKMINDQARDLKDARDAELAKADGSVEAINRVNAKYNEQVDRLLDVARQAGATQSVLDGLAKDYHINFIVTFEQRNATALTSKLMGLSKFDLGLMAAGGPVGPGTAAIVGEAGAELLQIGPGGHGQITPLKQYAGAAAQMYSGGAGFGGSATPVIQNNVFIVDPATGATRRASLITDGRARGVPNGQLAAAYP